MNKNDYRTVNGEWSPTSDLVQLAVKGKKSKGFVVQ